MAKTNRICKTCGKAYYYCPTCDFEKRPTWFAMWDSEKCKDMFMLLSAESMNKVSTIDAKKQLLDMGVTLDDSFTEPIKKHITRVFECDEIVKEYEINNVEELSDLEVVNEETINKKELNITPKKNRRKKISEEIEE